MLDKNFNVAITDFSIASEGSVYIRDRTPDTITELYSAPEMEDSDCDSSVDIWAIGIILYQLMYNSMPFLLTQYNKK